MPASTNIREVALLSVQRALVGEVDPSMRFIAVDIVAGGIHLIVWHYGLLSEEVVEDFDAAVVTQVLADGVADFALEHPVTFEFLRSDGPAKPVFRGTLVFGRKET
jgi:hypothetical protein